MKLAIRRQSLI